MANYQNLKAAISAAIRTNGNQEITGQVLQDVLNSIVSVIGANYTFAGVATPATNPGTPDQNVMYLAMEGGTYTNFNGTVLPAGISLLMWNGLWTSETVMYGDGGVFDISVYKSSGGTLATFADLSAALDGGNNIPASARKGGMSVKFVQSSDNRYVQYRLISDTFSTTVTDWQGVDDEPTAESDNLVKSGGVNKAVNELVGSSKGSIEISNQETKEFGNVNIDNGERFDITINSTVALSKIVIYANGTESSNRIVNKTYSTPVTSVTFNLTANRDISKLLIYIESSSSATITYSVRYALALELDEKVPADGSIGTEKLTDGAVTLDKLNSDVLNKMQEQDAFADRVSKCLSLANEDRSNTITYQESKIFSISGGNVSVETAIHEWYVVSNPIAVSKGDILVHQTDTMPTLALVCKTDSEGNIIRCAYNAAGVTSYIYVVDFNGYLIFNSNNKSNANQKVYLLHSEVFAEYYNTKQCKYFTELGTVGNRIIELYLTGLDSSKQYYITMLSRNNGCDRFALNDSEGNTVARLYDANIPSNKGVQVVYERNSSGISGYAIVDIESTLVYNGSIPNLASGYIDKDVVGNLDESPSIKQYLFENNEIDGIVGILGTDTANMYSQITWNTGFYYIYKYGQIDQDSNNAGCRIRENESYKYSSPFLMKKGDIIEYDLRNETVGSTFPDDPATALVVRITQDGIHRESILNQVEQGIGQTDRKYYRFVADRDMYVACNIKTAYNTAEYFKWYRSVSMIDSKDNLLERHPFYVSNEAVTLLEQCAMPNTGETGAEGKQLCLIHLSDIHNDYFRYKNVCQFRKKYSRYINDVIITGDLTGSSYYNFNRSILNIDGYDEILKVIGNHDVYDHNGDAVEQGASSYADREYWATSAEKYKLWMQGAIEGSERNDIALWNVVQPENATTLGLCYYYKDYTEQKVRLIVLDAMDVDEHNVISTAQLNWFEGVLTETITEGNAAYGYHVIIADHFATRTSFADTHYLNCGFTNIIDPTFGGIGQRLVPFCDKVDTFINNGGVFICWICGHFHWDVVATTVAHPKQLFIAVAAAAAGHNYTYRERVPGHKSEDCFNVVAVDTYTKHVRVARIGCEFNKFLQHAGTMCLSYDTAGDKVPQLLSSW